MCTWRLIESERGNTKRALDYLDDAKVNYDASYGKLHANHGDLLVNRAVILAKAGRMIEARDDCREGHRHPRPDAGQGRRLHQADWPRPAPI